MAWFGFLAESFRRSVEDARLRPDLFREAVIWSAVGGLLWLGLLTLGGTWWGPVWWGVVVAMLLTHVGMVEGDDGQRRADLGVPNALTLSRAWVVPALPALTDVPWAFAVVIAIATGTDVLDGYLARRGDGTRLGAHMDHGVDTAFTITAGIAAAAAGLIPWWLGWAIVARYALPILGLAAFYFATARQPPRDAFVRGRIPGGLLLLGLMAVTHPATQTGGVLLITVAVAWGLATLGASGFRSLRAAG